MIENQQIGERTRKELVIWIIFLIYITDSILFAANSISIFMWIKRGSVVLLGGYFLFGIIKKRMVPKVAFATIIACVSIIASMLLAGRWFNGYSYITQCACLLVAYAFSQKYSLEEFGEIFLRIISVIAVFSIITIAFRRQLVAISAIPVLTNINGVRYKFLLLSNLGMSSVSMAFVRNQGPFWEPGAYQVYLNIALYIALFVEKNFKKQMVYSAIFIIALITTGSGAALLPAALIFTAYLLHRGDKRKALIIIFAIIVIVIMYNGGLLDNILNKSLDSTGESFQIRMYSAIGNLYAFLRSPVFGSTPEACYVYREYIVNKFSSVGYYESVNTFPAYFAYYGLYVGAFYLWMLIESIRSNVKAFFPAMLVVGAIILSSTNEDFTTSLFFTVFLFLRSSQNTVAEYSD